VLLNAQAEPALSVNIVQRQQSSYNASIRAIETPGLSRSAGPASERILGFKAALRKTAAH
jgi:hypothetical protein